jgi:hypothetical protein
MLGDIVQTTAGKWITHPPGPGYRSGYRAVISIATAWLSGLVPPAGDG